SHFIVDAGWMPTESITDTSCLYLPEDQRVNTVNFPNGLKAVTDKLKDLGLSPAIWWPPSIYLESKLAKDHPDWMAKDISGATYTINADGFLDYSLPEVQEFLHQCFRIMFKEWGFEAMKLDFWSQGAESGKIRFKGGGTPTEWRDWLLGTIRSYLPPDGFLETCVATAMGNPFLGKHAQLYRSCIDVGACTWKEHLNASCWVQPMLSFPSRRICLQSIDGLGVNKSLSDHENLHRLTYGFISMGGIEIAGRLEELGTRHAGWIRKLTEHVDRGYPVKCPDDDAYTGKPYPKVLYVDYPQESPAYQRGVRKHVALLNWNDTAQYVGATASELGLGGKVTLRDFWTDKKKILSCGDLFEFLPPRSAKLYEINN
ncbi:MAG: alpha-galactosidase, partial [Planctomycetes bacterium]|nr:alpha-galactosidase [Planctomycetota bacterium]